MKSMLLLCVLLSSTAHAQSRTFTNADLGKPLTSKPAAPAVYATLKARETRIALPVRETFIDSTSVQTTSSGPWDWPQSAPRRRLDGSLLSDPPAVYGLPLWFYVHQRAGVSRHSNPERKR
jgi:hypothetical protein